MSIHVFGKMKYIGDLSLESINSDIEKIITMCLSTVILQHLWLRS